MNSALLKRALEIVDNAMELSASARSEFIQQACHPDDRLLREVQSFLKYENGVSIAPTASAQCPVQVPGADGTIARYELNDEIARGGMGAVLRAYDNVLERWVAVKVLLDEHADNADLLRRFIGEAQIGARLQHPGIAPVYDLGLLPDGRPFFAMKLVRGETLAALLSKRRDHDAYPSKLMTIFEQLCQAVAYAHSQQIIHRDLKPENVMVGQFGEVQVMDWGLAKVLNEKDSANDDPELREFHTEFDRLDSGHSPSSTTPVSPLETRLGQTMGTPAYMPPEQTIGLRAKTTDVFALGAILSEILTGQPPYTAPTPTEVHAKSARGNIDDAMRRLDQCGADQELVSLAKNCLATSPVDRLRDAKQVAGEISAYLKATRDRLQAAVIAAARAETEALEERKRRRLTLALASSGLVIILLIAGGWTFVSWQQVQREKQRIAQQIRNEDQVNTALTDAVSLFERAKAAPLKDLNPWLEARAAVGRAESLVQAHEVNGSLFERVKHVSSDIQAGESARKLVFEIETAREKLFDTGDYRREDPEAQRDALETLFRRFEIHPELTGPQESSDLIKAYSAKPRDELIGALDQWMLSADKITREWLENVVDAADADPWRRAWRRAVIEEDTDELIRVFRHQSTVSQSPRSILNLCQSVRQVASTDERIRFLRNLQPEHVTDFWFNYRLGSLLAQEDRVVEAVEYYQAALGQNPKARIHGFVSDALHHHLGRYEEATAHLKVATRLEPDFFLLWNMLGQNYNRVANWEEAEGPLRRSLELQPDNPYTMATLGRTLTGLGELEEAETLFRNAHQRQPHSALTCAYDAVLMRKQGKLVEAAQMVETFAHSQPSYLKFAQIERLSKSIIQATTESNQREDLNDTKNVKLRALALGWLHMAIKENRAGERDFVPQNWITSQEFAAVREHDPLEQLGPDEAERWRQLWREIAKGGQPPNARLSAFAADWHVLRPDDINSTSGADLELQPDDSILASGSHTTNDVYTINVPIKEGSVIAAFRLEVLADRRLPGNGPGRHETGNFQLGEIELEIEDSGDSPRRQRLSIEQSWADYSWRERPVSRAIDDDVTTAWHVWGELGKSHVAVLMLDEPYVCEQACTLCIKLRHGGDLGTGLGRFRLSITRNPWFESIENHVPK